MSGATKATYWKCCSPKTSMEIAKRIRPRRSSRRDEAVGRRDATREHKGRAGDAEGLEGSGADVAVSEDVVEVEAVEDELHRRER